MVKTAFTACGDRRGTFLNAAAGGGVGWLLVLRKARSVVGRGRRRGRAEGGRRRRSRGCIVEGLFL